MHRRTALSGIGLMAGLATSELAQTASSAHVHGDGKNAPLIKAAGSCIQTGEICINHCLQLLGTAGQVEMSACARSVEQMLAVCGALQSLAAADSKYLPKLAAIAAESCRDCEEECRKHADKHAVCKDCAESCVACARECKSIAG